MVELQKAAGAAIVATVSKHVTTQQSSWASGTTTRTNHGSIHNPMFPLTASTSYGRVKEELQIKAKEQELANTIHETGTNLDCENVDICAHLTALGKREIEGAALKVETMHLMYQRSLQRKQVASLEDMIRQNDMEMKTMRKRAKELEDGSAEWERENSQLAEKNKELTRALESAIISITLEEHQTWVKIVTLQENRMQNEMELQCVLRKLREQEDNVAESRREISRLVQEYKDFTKHWLQSASSTAKETEEEDKNMRRRRGKKTSWSEKSACNSGSSSKRRRSSVLVCPINDEEDVDNNGGVACSISNSFTSSSSARISLRDGKWRKDSAWLQTSFRSSFYVAAVIR